MADLNSIQNIVIYFKTYKFGVGSERKVMIINDAQCYITRLKFCKNRPVHIFYINIRVKEKNVLSEYLKSHNACE